MPKCHDRASTGHLQPEQKGRNFQTKSIGKEKKFEGAQAMGNDAENH